MRGDHSSREVGLGLDLLGDDAPQVARSLGVTNQDKAAPLVELSHVVLERVENVLIGKLWIGGPGTE